MSFKAKAMIETEDGRKIDIKMELNLSRKFVSETNISFKAGEALVDPLVINFDGKGASLSTNKIAFDLDSDGKDDNISFVNQGSGVLAIDKNKDGIVNNGSELLGPNTGNGFEELSQYDGDGNGWIDENDKVFKDLRLWVKDQYNNDYLMTLEEKGIGAICLGSIDTNFGLKDKDNTLLGQMQTTSIYLNENGTAGAVHQIDLTT
jgi:hypothetical protein